MDGPNFVTQCPIPAGGLALKIKLEHTVNGLRGPFIIDDPNSPYKDKYDEDITVTLSDFHHNNSDYLIEYFTSPDQGNIEPIPESGLINSVGRYNCSFAPKDSKCKPNNPLYVFNVVKGRRYRLRLINTSAMSMFTFSIDNHDMTVIEADGVYTVATHSVIVDTNQAINNYHVRADIDTSMWAGPTDTNGFNPEIRAIWRYKGAPIGNPKTSIQNVIVPLNPYTLPELVNTFPKTLQTFDKSYQLSFSVAPEGPENRVISTFSARNIAGGNTVPIFSMSQYQSPNIPTLETAAQGGRFPSSSNVIKVDNGSYVFIQVMNDDSGHLLSRRRFGGNTFARRDAIQVPPCEDGTGTDGEGGCRKGLLNIVVHFDHPGLMMTFVNDHGLGDLVSKAPPEWAALCKPAPVVGSLIG
ncbi:hypothetical protein HDU76_013861 [Blyttiomyces sp. JEL0837]|nr:hypothetical protein HDU76_013861 [Blyttiomyces sp. JEL0837]